MMNEELVKRLRITAQLAGKGLVIPRMSICLEAADAIEELSMKLHGDESAIAGMKREIERMVVSNASNTLNNDAMRWIPVTERLPESVCKSYLCLTDTGYHCEVRWTNNAYGLRKSDNNWGWSIADVPQYSKVTHWMPLPEPPKEEA